MFDFDFGDFDPSTGTFDFVADLPSSGYFLAADEAFDPFVGRRDDLNRSGILDLHEQRFLDADGNGIPDYSDGGIRLTDSGLPLQVEAVFLDVDGNGIPDAEEEGFLDLNGTGIPDIHEPFEHGEQALEAAALRRHLSRVRLANPFFY